MFVRDYWGTRTGGFALTLQRLNAPVGCTPLPFDVLPVVTSIGIPGAATCFALPPSAVGGDLRVRLVATSGTLDPMAEILRPDGITLCGPSRNDEFTCQVSQPGAHFVLVRDYWNTRTGAYSVTIHSSAPPPPPPGDAPAIQFTFVPAYGSFENLRGHVYNVQPEDYRVAVYIRVGDLGWWTKPLWATPTTEILPDGSWECDVTTGGYDQLATEFIAYLIPSSYAPPLASGQQTLPGGLDENSVAKVSVSRAP